MVDGVSPPMIRPNGTLNTPPAPRRPPALRSGSPIRNFSSARASTMINLETYINNNLPVDFLSNSSLADLVSNLSNQNSQLRYRLRVANEASAPNYASEKILSNIQEILFENSEHIPNGVYVKLMDALIGKGA